MTGRQVQPRVLRLGLLLLVAVVLACANDVNRSPSGSPVAGAPTLLPGAGTQLQEPFTPSPLAQYLLETATFQVSGDSKYSYIIVATLPTGITVATRYTLDPTPVSLGSLPAPDAPGSPLQAFHLAPQDFSANGILSWRYDYVLPTDGFPKDAFAAVADDSPPAWLSHVVQALIEPRPVYASGGDGVSVTVEGAGIAVGTEFLSHLESHHVAPDPRSLGSTAPLTAGAAGALAVYEALHVGKEYKIFQQRIEKVRKCAENPTNPLTLKNYAEHPEARQQALDEVSATRRATSLNTAVQFIGAMNAKAAGLAGKAAPWLGVVVETGTKWANSNLNAITDERIQQLERLVPKCEVQGNDWVGTVQYTYSEVADGVREDASATVTFEGAGQGTWTGKRVRTNDQSAKDCPSITTFATSGAGDLVVVVLDLSGRNPLIGIPAAPGPAQGAHAQLVIQPTSHHVSVDLDLKGTQTNKGGGPACPGYIERSLPIKSTMNINGEGPSDAGTPNVLSGTKTTTLFSGATMTVTWTLTSTN